jgi:cysteine desulfurase / selenocysteine lyase
MFDIEFIRRDFPILNQKIYGKPLVYLDNAASTQKPKQVLEALNYYYEVQNSNIHRGVHYLSQKATIAYEEVRETIHKFLNTRYSHEVIFTRGTTESINLVASSFGKRYVNRGDEIVVSAMEHHSNIVPWQMMCEERGATLRVIPMDEQGELILESLDSILTEKTRLVSVAHVSNALGTVNPIKTIIGKAHQKNIPVLIDGAQSVAHYKIDVQELDCDFYVFSGHKLYAPMGIGVLYGKEEFLNEMPPYHGGGEMIKEVTFAKTTYNDLPFKFEAGTPNVGDTLALQSAINYVENIGIEVIDSWENELLNYATQKLSTIEGIRFIGTAQKKAAVISFLIGNIHPFDMGTLLDRMGIAVRTGHHCAQPVMDFFRIPGTVRASFAFYNTKEEIDSLWSSILKAKSMLE